MNQAAFFYLWLFVMILLCVVVKVGKSNYLCDINCN